MDFAKPKKLPSELRIPETCYIGTWNYECGNNVPVFEAFSVHGLNRLIGHAKFNNHLYGNIYYRGESKKYKSVIPSLLRGQKNVDKWNGTLSKLIKKFYQDERIMRTINVVGSFDNCKEPIEGLLQHYGVPTRYVDMVDNHWVALWMGLNECVKLKQSHEYYHYIERELPLLEMAGAINPLASEKFNVYQYILLMAIPYSDDYDNNGVGKSHGYYEIDLRKALPSLFLRPHAQHGIVVRRIPHTDIVGGSPLTSDYDLAVSVVGIIKLRIDRVKLWMGHGELLTQNNLFPQPAYDCGYERLLMRSDLFKDTPFNIARYV
jgi:hypothetical protein